MLAPLLLLLIVLSPPPTFKPPPKALFQVAFSFCSCSRCATMIPVMPGGWKKRPLPLLRAAAAGTL